MKLNLVNISLSIFLVFLMVFFLLLPHFRKSKIEALNDHRRVLYQKGVPYNEMLEKVEGVTVAHGKYNDNALFIKSNNDFTKILVGEPLPPTTRRRVDPQTRQLIYINI